MTNMTETRNMAQEQADSWAQTLENIWYCVDNDEQYEDSDPLEYLDELPLEIVWEVGEPFAVVLGTGGPHTEITGGGRSGNYDLWSYWGGDKGRRSSDAIRRTGEYFRDLVDQS